MRIALAVLLAVLVTLANAKLPPQTEAEKAKADEAVAKSAWTDKVGLYLLCQTTDRIAVSYRKTAKANGKVLLPAIATPPCVDPGAYVSPAALAAVKPIEASGAHSPPGTVVAPPSTKNTAAEISAASKK